MKRVNFERPTDHYDQRILAIDEQICALLRKERMFQTTIQDFLRQNKSRNGQKNTISMRMY